MFPSRALKAAADSYKATDFTNPKYNYFFRELTARVQGVLLTGGSLYGTWLVVFGEAQR
ncbi:hypothetical protein CHLRE_12g483850v5 [Chlamydomonas reinhardtii]|uniref:Uncharacterized protein n=1 Tax=Chlamydomonas reinhardtii TaxID=3055 RepID=A0A2K3D1M1_CHLRE|nr:uncharacterized protein CHLRE_12g483850v5 [Chlamydomonas reinhardtii]PNW74433.1 hypothetical protein CHLRE_12g483850v5 [Chlamydomonas reinhardtii]